MWLSSSRAPGHPPHHRRPDVTPQMSPATLNNSLASGQGLHISHLRNPPGHHSSPDLLSCCFWGCTQLLPDSAGPLLILSGHLSMCQVSPDGTPPPVARLGTAPVWAKLANALFTSRCNHRAARRLGRGGEAGGSESWGRKVGQEGQRAGPGREAGGSEGWGREVRGEGQRAGAGGRQFVCPPLLP